MRPSFRSSARSAEARGAVQAKFVAIGNRGECLSKRRAACKDRRFKGFDAPTSSQMARDPTIAYVLLRNAHFGPRLASSVELCVRDLFHHSRYAGSTLVVCPKVDRPFEGIPIKTVPDVPLGGNLAKAWSVGRLLRRQGIDLAIVENHLPAAALIASASGAPAILHSHAYEKAASGALKRAARDFELRRISGLAFVSEDCANRFRLNFPSARAPMRAIPNGLDMADWSASVPEESTILSVGRALDDKGHVEAMRAIIRHLRSRPDWSARFILSAIEREPGIVRELRDAAADFDGRIRIETNLPYAEVKTAWEKAAVGMVLTKTPEPFGRTALEALASGTALVASGLGGLAEVCGGDALIVDPRDADGVASSLASLLDSPDLRAKLARSGRARVERLFDIRAVAKRMDDFVDEVLARPG
jgi:glycosyltransferase involved in cell wall biosynthesis